MSNAAKRVTMQPDLRSALVTLIGQLRLARDRSEPGQLNLAGEDPELMALAGLINDIIGSARNEVTQLQDVNQELDALVRQRTAELEHAKTIAELGSTQKSRFLTQMSHELRTPLNSIIGFGQLLLDSKKDELSARQAKQVKHILQGGRHLLGLINDVLDLSKIETGKLDLNIEAVAVDDLVYESLEMVKPAIDQEGLAFEDRTDPDLDPLGVKCDFLRAKQCLINLLNNACKYNTPGGKIWIQIKPFKSDLVRIVVGDTGLGIPEGRQHEMFRPFSRLGREETGIEGSGVGLALTRLLINAMKGVLDFESAEGQGSEFWIDLPRTEPPGDPDGLLEAGPVDVDKRAQGLVLYIEDIDSNVRLMEDMLGEYTDVEMITATSAEEGIAMALEQLPDLIVMDINLGGMNGIDATRYIRSVHTIRNIPIFALTGDVQEDIRARCEDAGVDAFFAKPIKVNDFIDAVRTTLDSRLGRLL
ncbi:MAG: hybrid sensor histidine kinase/response regulator [Rhodospirillales bacterium]